MVAGLLRTMRSAYLPEQGNDIPDREPGLYRVSHQPPILVDIRASYLKKPAALRKRPQNDFES